MVAQYADACNFFTHLGLEGLRHKLDVLHGHCDNFGRDYNEIDKTVLGHLSLGQGGKTPAEFISDCRALAELGFGTYIFSLTPADDLKQIETIGRQFIPTIAEF